MRTVQWASGVTLCLRSQFFFFKLGNFKGWGLRLPEFPLPQQSWLGSSGSWSPHLLKVARLEEKLAYIGSSQPLILWPSGYKDVTRVFSKQKKAGRNTPPPPLKKFPFNRDMEAETRPSNDKSRGNFFFPFFRPPNPKSSQEAGMAPLCLASSGCKLPQSISGFGCQANDAESFYLKSRKGS